MAENIRALIVVLFLATLVFAFARQSACDVSTAAGFTRRRNLWYGLTLAAFLASSFWVYLAVATSLLIYANRRESNPPALYFFILFALPAAYAEVPGMGLINYFFHLSHARVLALLIFLPAYLFLRKQDDTLSFGRTGPDIALVAYLLLTSILFLRGDTLTNSLRQFFYLFIDVFLPYFVISRSLKNLQSFRDALLSLVLAIMVIAPMAFFEFSKSWLLYHTVSGSLELIGDMTAYLGRDGIIRAVVSTGQAIALGFLMVVGIGIYSFVQYSIKQQFIRLLGMALLIAGLVAPLSRGPWVGAAVLLVVFILTGRTPVGRLIGLGLAVIIALPVVSTLPGGDRVINLLPYVGTTDKGSVDYREQLLTNSMIVINRHPWFGSIDYLETPEMEEMRQGQGIIDLVNTYIQVALEKGYVGLVLFSTFFALTLSGIYRAMRSIPDRDSEEYLLGRALFSTQIAILVIIFTVSSISVIPIIYWSVAGLGVAYAQMVRRNIIEKSKIK